jgi:UDP-N-acetylglucosamine 4,6-dehydratase/5-epimerase
MMNDIFEGKVLLVTGGVGSIGSELVKQLLKYNPKQIRIFDNRETETFTMQHELADYKCLRFFIGDVRDKDRLRLALKGVDIVFHAAALKHVPSCEYNPFEAVKTNVYGTQNLIDCALEEDVEKVINISTDKVTNTINTMGATKLLAERLISSAEFYKGHKKTLFCSVRFGNVLCSRGSVIELFKDQIANGGPITITNHGMTRFFMSIPQSIELVFKAAALTQGGEVFVLKMPTIQIKELAETVVEIVAPKHGKNPQDIQARIIGIRPGERMHEELLTAEEAENALETAELFIALPGSAALADESAALGRVYEGAQKAMVKNYNSRDEEPLKKEQIASLLESYRLL